MHWLAANLNGIVYDAAEKHHKRGCLEVKCPFLYKNMLFDVTTKNMLFDTTKKYAVWRYKKNMLFDVACKQVSSFCCESGKTTISLLKHHAYYYQVQTQMHVTQLFWCDFVVWSLIQNVLVEWVVYNPVFMKSAVQKAEAFHFKQFLPSIVSCVIFSDSPVTKSHTKSVSSVSSSQTKTLISISSSKARQSQQFVMHQLHHRYLNSQSSRVGWQFRSLSVSDWT